MGWSRGRDLDIVSLDDALQELAQFDPQQSQIVELRFFSGHSIDETANILGISPATVKRDWKTARLWLQREIRKSSRREPGDKNSDDDTPKSPDRH